MGADSRFYECTECWSLVRENSRKDHEAVHTDADKPRYVDCSVCGAQVHLSQRMKHGAWHDRMNRLLDDLTGRVIERAAGPATAQALAATPAASDKDAAISSILRTQSDLAVSEAPRADGMTFEVIADGETVYGCAECSYTSVKWGAVTHHRNTTGH